MKVLDLLTNQYGIIFAFIQWRLDRGCLVPLFHHHFFLFQEVKVKQGAKKT